MEFRLKHEEKYYNWKECVCGQKFPINPSKKKTVTYCPRCGLKTKI